MKSKRSKILRIVLIVILSILFVLYIILPAGFGLVASLRFTESVGAAPEDFIETGLTTEDGVKLAAWYKAPENGAVILLLHGSNGSRESMRPYIDALSRHGYGVLAVDLRGHGESEGAGNALGWQREKDVKAAVEFLREKGIASIGGLGTSLGGEILLGVCSQFPELKAVISDGATHSTLADYLVLPSRESIFRSWTSRVMYFFAGVFTGQSPPETTMLDSVTASSADFLFIAAEGTEEEIEYNTAFKEAAGERGQLWAVPEAGHTQAMSFYPQEYETRIVEFFDSTLLSE